MLYVLVHRRKKFVEKNFVSKLDIKGAKAMARFWQRLLSGLRGQDKTSTSTQEITLQYENLDCPSDIIPDDVPQPEAEAVLSRKYIQDKEDICAQPEAPLVTPSDLTQIDYKQCYVVLDIETTGLTPEFDDIIEFGAIKVENGQEIDSFNTLIDPGYPIPPYITQLTGITDSDVAGAPNLSTAIQDIAAFIGNLPVVAHNATFDLRFLLHADEKANLQANFHYFDTLTLSRHAFPNAPNHKLSTLIAYLGMDGEQEHRALSDVRFTHQIFCACRAYVDLSLFILPYPSTRSQRRKQYRARERYYIREAARQKAAIDSNHPLYQKRILFTGTMQMPRHQAAQLAEDCGALITGSVSKNTDYVVVGTQDISSSDIGNMSAKEEKAHWLNEHEDCHIQIINESEFFALVNRNETD